jgi:divalent metal cation (Fe/Co/Zn/Cd) transporter
VIWRLFKAPWRGWYEAGFADGASEALKHAIAELENVPGADAVRARMMARKVSIDLDIKVGQAMAARKEKGDT